MFRKTLSLVFYRALSELWGKGTFFIVSIAAAHRLSDRDFAVFALATTAGWMAGVVTDFGIQLHVARAVARAVHDPAAVLRTWLRVRLWTAGAAVVAIAIAVLAQPAAPEQTAAILLLALLYVGNSLIEFLYYFYRGLSRSDVESTLTICQRGATLVCALAALAWRPSLPLLAAAMLLPAIAALGFSLVYAQRLGRGTTFERLEPSRARPPALWSEFSREVFPIGLGIVLSALYFRIDIFLVQLWSDTHAVALYGAAFRLVDALRLVPAAVLAVMLPALCRAHDTRPLWRVAGSVTAFAAIAAAVLWAAAGWTIPFVYGAPFVEAVPAFRILLFAFPLLSLNYALTHQLIGWDGQRAYAAICGVALAANVTINSRLIPAAGIEGAAWATLLTEVVLTAGCSLALWLRQTGRAAGTLPASIAS
jgi:O-antigen/teichoic acid export membrane protein